MSEPRISVSDPRVNGTAPEQATPAEELPLLPIDSAVLFPGMFLPLVVSGDSWVKLVDDAALGSRQIGVFWRSRPDEAFDPLSLARTGVAAQIVRLLRQPDGGVQLLLQGQARIQLEQLLTTEPYPRARVRTLKTPEEPSLELEGLTRSALTAFQQIVQQSPSLPAELSVVAANLTAPGQLADLIAANLSITPADRQAVLDTLDPVERLRLVIGYLEREREILAIGERAREELSRSQRDYTHEAGVRDLERRLGAIYRKLATRLAEGEPLPAQVDGPDLDALLGPPRFRSETLLGEDEVGVVTGLAWTPAGGDVLFVEASAVAGSGQLILTGQLGDVMRESARAALTYTHSRAEQLGIPPDFAQKQNIHIHVPAGAVPKDGPSAGITMASALASALSERPAHKHVAMTGEITLRGKVLPIGGLKEKLLAAQRAGVTKVLLPRANEPDLREVPAETRAELELVLVSHMDEVLPHVLHPQAVAVGAET